MHLIIIFVLVFALLQGLLYWAWFFSPALAIWLEALLLIPPALISLGYWIFLRRAAGLTSKPFQERLGHALRGSTSISLPTKVSFAEVFVAAFGDESRGPSFRRRALEAYLLSVAVLTVIWALAWPGDAARLLYDGGQGTLDPPLKLGRAVLIFLGYTVFFFPAFYVSLQLAHRAVVKLPTTSGGRTALLLLAVTAGTTLAVLATNSLLLATIEVAFSREHESIGLLDSLHYVFPHYILLQASSGFPSNGVFIYACFFALGWFAVFAAAQSLARRFLRVPRLARLQTRPFAAIGTGVFVAVFGVNLIILVARIGLSPGTTIVPEDAETRSGASLQQVVDQFDHLVFGPSGTWRVEKHEEPVVVRVIDEFDVATGHMVSVRETISTLNSLTRLPVRLANDNGSEPNLDLVFAERRVFNRMYMKRGRGLDAGPFDSFLCLTMRLSRVLIGTDNEPQVIRNCIPHEFMHAVGFSGHACYYRPSALCALDPDVQRFTRGDELLIATLYDPNIKNGMSRKEALPIARTVLKLLQDTR